jgi:hypothetical protein
LRGASSQKKNADGGKKNEGTHEGIIMAITKSIGGIQ